MNVAIKEFQRIERENKLIAEMERIAAPFMYAVIIGTGLFVYWILQ
jgi:hypothetical protein